MNPSSASQRLKLQQAVALHQKGLLSQAQTVYQEILDVEPRHFDALHMLGVIAAQTSNPQRAAELIDRAIGINPRSAAAFRNRGLALHELGQLQAALESYNRAIAIRPDYAEAYFNRGLVLSGLAQYRAALESYDRAIALKPDHVEAHCNRGNVLIELDQPAAAVASYDRAIAIAPHYAMAYSNRGNALKRLKQLDAAVASYDKAIALSPDYAEAYFNRGVVLYELKRPDAALASYDRAIAIKADHAEAHWYRSLVLLLLGDFANGWIGYEWRWKNRYGTNIHEKRAFSQPLWLGQEPIAGKAILLHSEQGLGDTIQFCRYVKMVAARGARVILEVQARLVGLLGNLEGVSQIVAKGGDLPRFDYQCPLLSLPLAFNTDLNSIPAATQYLGTDAGLVARWQGKLGDRTGPRVGLAWSGNPSNTNDHNRSVPLADLIAHLPAGFQYVSLQKDLREADAQTLRAAHIVNFADEQRDFSDAAALLECMDLVISVDTSVAHLSGALGRETWVLLTFAADWRWLLDRTDSPWYPSMRLVRQQHSGDWRSVFEQVAADLIRRLACG